MNEYPISLEPDEFKLYDNGNNTVIVKLVDSEKKIFRLIKQNKIIIMDKNDNDAFDRSVEIHSMFFHPCFPKLFGTQDRKNGAHSRIEEYIPGGTLEQYVNQRNILRGEKYEITSADKLDFFLLSYGIAYAIRILHSKEVMHRDINPGNIIVTPNKKAVLIGFGFARKFSKYDTKEKIDYTNRGEGTYTSPEIRFTPDSTTTYNEMTDIYSYGATLLFMITGVEPNQYVKDQIQQQDYCNEIPFFKGLILECCEYNLREKDSYDKRPPAFKICEKIYKEAMHSLDEINYKVFLQYAKELEIGYFNGFKERGTLSNILYSANNCSDVDLLIMSIIYDLGLGVPTDHFYSISYKSIYSAFEKIETFPQNESNVSCSSMHSNEGV